MSIKNNIINSLPLDFYLGTRRTLFRLTRPKAFQLFQKRRQAISTTSYSYKSLEDTRSIFIHIPKCAGVAVSQALYGNLGGGHTTFNEYLYIFKPDELSSYFKFTIVRNPWDRLVSSFYFLKSGGFNATDNAWFKRELSGFRTFDAFVKGWINEENIWKYSHFRPQHHYISVSHRRIKLDFIGCFETIETDFDYITRKLNISTILRKTNSSPRNNYRNYYTDESQKIVANVYKKDIELFGYRFDDLTEREFPNRESIQ